MKIINVFIIIIVLFSFGQAQYSEKIQVLSVSVEGNIRISDEDIIRNARLWSGKQIDIEDNYIKLVKRQMQ